MQTHILETLAIAYEENPYVRYTALTITPHDHTNSTQEGMEKVAKLLTTLYRQIISVYLVYETSDNGKLHAHGIIIHRDKCAFVKAKKHPVYQVYTKPMEYPYTNWINYMIKEKPNWSSKTITQQQKTSSGFKLITTVSKFNF